MLIWIGLSGTPAWAAQRNPPRMYAITIETGMPHLEENLRYAVTREKHCLAGQEIFFVFPILSHESLKGCKLGDERRGNNSSTWTLMCEDSRKVTGRTTGTTTGQAIWFLDARQITGTLNVRLGGKNMTFYQRATLRPLGECRPRTQ